MFPPTPTPLPPAPIAPVALDPIDWRIWNFTDEVIMVWQGFGAGRQQVLQIAILLAIIIGFVYLLIKWLGDIDE